MQHQPVEWTLMVPATLTPSERTFLDKLAEGHQVVVSVMDRPALDNGFADFPNLEATFTREHLREAAWDFNHEQALLFDGDDLVERVRRLGERADTVHEDWTWDFERRGDELTRTLRALHPQASERSSITIPVASRPDGMDDRLTAAINRTLGFGIAEEVTVPPEALESLTIRGPEFIAQHITDATLTWRPITLAAAPGVDAEISFRTADDVVTARHTGRLTSVGAGALGTLIEIDVLGAVLQMMLPFNADTAATLRYSYDLDGREPGEAAKVLRIQQRLLQGGGGRVTMDGTPAGSGTLPATGTPEELHHIRQMLLYFADLDVVQRHCEAFFPAPHLHRQGAHRPARGQASHRGEMRLLPLRPLTHLHPERQGQRTGTSPVRGQDTRCPHRPTRLRNLPRRASAGPRTRQPVPPTALDRGARGRLGRP
ncbi:hypothetical protein [Streptomyces sp. NPDC005548]|uniref:hypothetical protein n=1 Tax=Streptomyces sp. NPDC005548 TaxID=3364724 RepID=UPI00369670BE